MFGPKRQLAAACERAAGQIRQPVTRAITSGWNTGAIQQVAGAQPGRQRSYLIKGSSQPSHMDTQSVSQAGQGRQTLGSQYTPRRIMQLDRSADSTWSQAKAHAGPEWATGCSQFICSMLVYSVFTLRHHLRDITLTRWDENNRWVSGTRDDC